MIDIEQLKNRVEWPTEDLQTLLGAIRSEISRRDTIDNATQPDTDLEDAASQEPVREYEGGIWLPGQTMIVDGKEWVNTSGVVLSVGPNDYPLGYGQRVDNPAEYPQWEPELDVEEGEIYEHDGTAYRVIQGHTTQEGWEPDKTPALWQEAFV